LTHTTPDGGETYRRGVMTSEKGWRIILGLNVADLKGKKKTQQRKKAKRDAFCNGKRETYCRKTEGKRVGCRETNGELKKQHFKGEARS